MADPKEGDQLIVRGQLMTILQLRPMGTVDVQAADGKCYRVTGLNYLTCSMTRITKRKQAVNIQMKVTPAPVKGQRYIVHDGMTVGGLNTARCKPYSTNRWHTLEGHTTTTCKRCLAMRKAAR